MQQIQQIISLNLGKLYNKYIIIYFYNVSHSDYRILLMIVYVFEVVPTSVVALQVNTSPFFAVLITSDLAEYVFCPVFPILPTG